MKSIAAQDILLEPEQHTEDETVSTADSHVCLDLVEENCVESPSLRKHPFEEEEERETDKISHGKICGDGLDGPEKQYRTSSLARNEKSRMTEKIVTWDLVVVHSHIMQLGDNPAVSNGVPVTVSWKAQHVQTVSIDAYEEQKKPPKTKDEMLLPRETREKIVRASGSSRSEILKETFNVKRIQEERTKSSMDGEWRRKLSKLSPRRWSIRSR
eukprot:CAMPEP_0172467712 /NCGR_PEP_ID=MMETSP1065-20121228/59638_1 /TAXON_ID=265537 /ORGANISM="Amphiprora paludosa, Strain CCMP125" /LENGTH=212 /DNA_ID=CAMNT_0013224939 /DNA_START=91 /DNA_END=726 /DNA_ORIENTATION=-